MGVKGKRGKKSLVLSVEQIITQKASMPDVQIIIDEKTNGSPGKAGVPYHFSDKTKVLTLYADILASKHPNLLSKIIKTIHEEGGLIFRSNAANTLMAYNDYHNSAAKSAKKVLAFFEPIIDKSDFEALRASLYLRYHSDNGGVIDQYRIDIKDRYGSRGTNISNLCSAGYFDTEFQDMYRKLEEKEFHEYYDIAVGKRGRALFVHAHMTKADIEDQFTEMVGKAILYHMADFRVHAKGTKNVSNIMAFIKSVQEDPENWQSIVAKRIYYNKSVPVIVFEIQLILDDSN